MNYAAIPTSARFVLPAIDPESELVNVVVEATRGSSFKYKFEPDSDEFVLDKRLPAGTVFPFDFGFIPSTTAQDGDPLDVMVLLEEPSFVGAVVRVRLIGLIEVEQTELGQTVRNDRLLGVLETRYNPTRFETLEQVDSHLLADIERFFTSYNTAENRVFKTIGRGGPEKALRLLALCGGHSISAEGSRR
jgi:inorganic pyrophosphatase